MDLKTTPRAYKFNNLPIRCNQFRIFTEKYKNKSDAIFKIGFYSNNSIAKLVSLAIRYFSKMEPLISHRLMKTEFITF